MFQQFNPLEIESLKPAAHSFGGHAGFRSPLDAPTPPWAKVSPSFLSSFSSRDAKKQAFRCKEEFLSISQLLSEKLGMPTAGYVLAGSIVGSANWEGLTLAKQYRAVTEAAGVFEASAMTYWNIQGADAEKVLDMLTPRDVSKL